jgi:PadR family transcriptional regulator, regulatory protein PadR
MISPLSVRCVVLLCLRSGRELYGQGVIAEVERITQGKLQLKSGSVHPVLLGLEEEGLVKARVEEPPEGRGGRPPVYYRLTAAGKALAREQVRMISQLCGKGRVKKR